MSTPTRTRAGRAGRLLLLGALALLAGCEHGFFADAPMLPADLHVGYDLAPAAQIGGPESAFDKVTAVHLTWSLASEAVHDTTIAFTPDAEVTVSLSIPMRSNEAQLQLSLALLSGEDSIFTGATTAGLRAGQTTAAEVELSPVAARLALGEGITMTAIGDTTLLGGNVVFATGDIIPDRPITWTSSDPTVAAVVDGRVVSRKEGSAQLSARSGALSGTVPVTVAAVVTAIRVTPDSSNVDVGRKRQLVATAVDRRGNALGRTITWSSSTPGVATVDGNGQVTGVSRGSATITASAGGKSGSAKIVVVNPTGEITGTVVNATSGELIVGALVELADTLGTPITSVETDASGQFHIAGVRAGVYRITARADGAIDDARRVTVQAGETTTVTFALSPHLGEGQTRIVLTWGASPADLDSHLLVPGGYEVYFGDLGSDTVPPYAQLDLDDTSSYGPETTTIFNQLPGAYCFFVYNYSGTGSFQTSSAQVKVYQGDGLVASFNTPTSTVDGLYWTVFSLNGSTITPVNAVGTSFNCPAVPAEMRRQLENRPRKLK